MATGRDGTFSFSRLRCCELRTASPKAAQIHPSSMVFSLEGEAPARLFCYDNSVRSCDIDHSAQWEMRPAPLACVVGFRRKWALSSPRVIIFDELGMTRAETKQSRKTRKDTHQQRVRVEVIDERCLRRALRQRALNSTRRSYTGGLALFFSLASVTP